VITSSVFSYREKVIGEDIVGPDGDGRLLPHLWGGSWNAQWL